MTAENKRTHGIIKSKGKKSNTFWRVANSQEEEAINSLKKSDGSQTTTQEETLKKVHDHFQDLLTSRERPPNPNPRPMPNIGKSRSLIKKFTDSQVRKALLKLPSNKATGPDGIPNEALKMGAALLAPYLRKAFNQILLRGEPISAWAEGIMYLIYKGKGNKSDLDNYRGITVNNSLSKVFASLLNDRLSKLVEKRGVLGQIQNGGRSGRQGLDSLFVLRTVLEKSAGSGSTAEKDLALIFLDLSKAFDKVPHDLLWDKLARMGFHPTFIRVLQSLYKDTYVTILVNGCPTEKVYVRSGVKQGCPLSPLLFTLFICDIGQLLQQAHTGALIRGIIISALLFVDDLIIIGRNREKAEWLLTACQYHFELNGLEINCSKTNILSKENVINQNISLQSTYYKTTVGEIELKEKYKYLGVNVSLGKAADIFRFHRKIIVSRLRSYAGLILSMARNSYDPIEVGEALWKSVALESTLYGIQIISVNKQILSQLDSIQATFAADLMGVNRSASHVGILREFGWNPISSLVMERKLQYWARLSGLSDDTWAKQALLECMSAQYPCTGAWRSAYRQEIQDTHTECKIGNILKDGHTPKYNVKRAVEQHFKDKTMAQLSEHRLHSLKYLPDYPDGMGRQGYIERSESSTTLAKFRLGNANLGNRETPPILICPSCNAGPNNELHLAFECPAMSHLRKDMQHILDEARDHQRFATSDNRKLKSFLGDDLASAPTLRVRGLFLDILRQKHLELKEANS